MPDDLGDENRRAAVAALQLLREAACTKLSTPAICAKTEFLLVENGVPLPVDRRPAPSSVKPFTEMFYSNPIPQRGSRECSQSPGEIEQNKDIIGQTA